jgi:hypothetical protein
MDRMLVLAMMMSPVVATTVMTGAGMMSPRMPRRRDVMGAGGGGGHARRGTGDIRQEPRNHEADDNQRASHGIQSLLAAVQFHTPVVGGGDVVPAGTRCTSSAGT